MRLTTLAAVSALALGVTACGPRVDYAARTKLDCPDHEGRLSRVSIAADGKSCLYRAGDVDVNLQLTPVTGSASATLGSIEASLTGPAGGQVQPASAPAMPAAAAPGPSAGTSSDAAKAAHQASADAHGGSGSGAWSSGGNDRRGVRVDDDDNAHVNLPGLHIDANDNGARVDVAGIHIDANDTNATVRMMRTVRLRGHPFAREKDGIRATFIAHREDLPGGYRVVGYEASGPKTGPLSVAIIKSREDVHEDGGLYEDIQRLVRRNGGA